MNDSLRRALIEAQLSEQEVAARLAVDPKTVRRWLAGRVPYPRYRSHLAALVGAVEEDLWPELALRQSPSEPPVSEVVTTYPHRWMVPREAWDGLFQSARREIGILVYAGLFLAEDIGVQRTLVEQADRGVMVRILLGDPESTHVAARGEDEGVHDAIAAKIRNALVLCRPLLRHHGVDIRLHRTTLYTSIYRADDELLINPHIYGVAAAQAPVVHLRKAGGGDMVSTYTESFERVWVGASPLI